MKLNTNNNDYIASNSKTREIIGKHGLTLKKNLGQNFLIDLHVMQKILSAADVTSEDYVLEIGPGIGSLTQQLALGAGHVCAIEIDSALIPILHENLDSMDNVEIIHNDILKTDVDALLSGCGYQQQNIKVVANLPYYITTPIIMGLLEKRIPINTITVMVQKEVGERIRAVAGNKDYGSLSIAVQYYAIPELVANVPQNCFLPRPGIDSAVIKLSVRKKPAIDVENEGFFFELTKAAFGQRRKTLVNCLYNLMDLELTKEELSKILISNGLSDSIRGEALSPEEFALLSNALYKAVNDKIL